MTQRFPEITRRSLLTAAAATPALAFSKAIGAPAAPTLRGVAQSRGRLYGAAVRSDMLASDPAYRDLVAKQAGILVCEGETKRNTLQPTPDRFNFGPADQIWRFAQANNQLMRGHTLMWHQSVPGWLEARLAEKPDERLITDYITTVVGRYRGRFHSWDVVNEVTNPDEGEEHGMRRSSPWFKAFGERYIDIAFQTAKAADPNAILFLNELNAEPDVRWGARIRKATLDLIDRLIKRNVPIEAVGIQAHLKAYRVSYSQEVFSAFLDELTARGLKIMITELDVADIDGPANPEQRDEFVADLAGRMLDVALSKPQTLGCLTWGITDRFSWLSTYANYKWPDGQFSRSLPFDSNYRPKAMFDAMIRSYSRLPAT